MRRRLGRAATAGVLGLLAGLTAPARAGAVSVGDAAPGFTLPDWEGRPVTLGELRGRVVIVDFWATWCGLCTPALPALDAIARRHDASALRVLAVDIDRDAAAADRFVTERVPAPALTLLRDPEAAVLSRFGAPGMPAVYLIDREGVVRFVDSGYSPAQLDALERTLARLLDGTASSPASTRASGTGAAD